MPANAPRPAPASPTPPTPGTGSDLIAANCASSEGDDTHQCPKCGGYHVEEVTP